MEERVAKWLREAALRTSDLPGWTITIQVEGVRVTYTWQPDNKNWYTVEALVPWHTLEDAQKNPLLVVLDDLTKQYTEWKP